MNAKYHWSIESWGTDVPPENASDIIAWANGKIDSYCETDFEKQCYSETLWNRYCEYDERVREIIDNGYYLSAVQLMDDDIREAVHNEFAPCSEYVFLLEYFVRHKKAYKCDFVI